MLPVDSVMRDMYLVSSPMGLPAVAEPHPPPLLGLYGMRRIPAPSGVGIRGQFLGEHTRARQAPSP